jgi:hypothetical protein
VLVAFCWTISLLHNVAAFTGMLLYPESTLQLCSSRRFCEVFKEVYFGSLSAVWMTWYFVRTLISQQHQSERRDLSVRMPLCVQKLRTVQGCIRPDVMANRPDAIQSSRGIQRSSASVLTTWLYRPDAIQCLTNIRVSTQDTVMGRWLLPSGQYVIPSGRFSL